MWSRIHVHIEAMWRQVQSENSLTGVSRASITNSTQDVLHVWLHRDTQPTGTRISMDGVWEYISDTPMIVHSTEGMWIYLRSEMPQRVECRDNHHISTTWCTWYMLYVEWANDIPVLPYDVRLFDVRTLWSDCPDCPNDDDMKSTETKFPECLECPDVHETCYMWRQLMTLNDVYEP